MKVIGAGVGRTGTYSLKLAINQLGLGPCHHMEEVLLDLPRHVALWNAALQGDPDWEAVFDGYESAVDWPTASFYRELLSAYPQARFVLTVRAPERWVESFSETIYKLLADRDQVPEPMQDWLDMAIGVVAKCGFSQSLDKPALMKAFMAHTEAVQSVIPSERLLIFEVKDGWEPLCDFLDVPVPVEPFPRSNDRGEFWDRVSGTK